MKTETRNLRKSTLTRKLGHGEEMVYQMISSEPICLREECDSDAYSILVARTDGEVVMDSALAYDVSRDAERCCEVMEELWRSSVVPEDIKDAVSELL